MQRSIHVEVSLQDPLLERIGLLPLRTRWRWCRDVGRRSRHLADALSSLMHRHLWGLCGGRGGCESRTLRLRYGALGTGSKLLRPVEATSFT